MNRQSYVGLLIAALTLSGLALVIAVRRGWQGPRWIDVLDVFKVQRLLDSAAGGRAAYYGLLGWLFLAIGLIAAFVVIVAG